MLDIDLKKEKDYSVCFFSFLQAFKTQKKDYIQYRINDYMKIKG